MTLVFLGLFVLLLILIVKSSLSRPGFLLKAIIHVLGGIVGLWLFDLLFSILGFGIPINYFTIIIVALMGFPGVLLLTVLQIIGI
ncbi:MAG: pro-sigmaK processing inhibitor BofA family protein [Desulfitobacteriaceae bacterium]|nr:pro-sigmaK processing inhibitor BofA family protein [Desulfitobacteriaceae bacterium]MDD4345372.1 pro-sigmaK processing inhibitor BofA family protein [Desulfitobacteriaceae bacterium]MDD4400305.1 pro-sigmaK processing inhibitor BofA family protein [Desulfitobacteriaceae bacterium]